MVLTMVAKKAERTVVMKAVKTDIEMVQMKAATMVASLVDMKAA